MDTFQLGTDQLPRTFGATGDGQTDDTHAVQAAVDAAAARGGGRVVLLPGDAYRCGSIELKSNVELHLAAGSRLVAATDPADYSRTFRVGALAAGESTGSRVANGALIWAEGASDVAITGTGTIDGSAPAYVRGEGDGIYRMDPSRPFPVILIGCTGVLLRDVRLVDAALWTVRLSGCVDVHIDGIRIANDMRVPNADGIDIDHCKRVRVVGCDIRCPDDGICLKTTDEFAGFGGTSDVLVTACAIESRSTAITIGVETDRPIRNVVVTGCTIRNSHRGISVSMGTGPGGDVENVLFSDLVIETRHDGADWWGAGEPIMIRSAPWHEQAGAVRRVRIRNILARAENGIVIYAQAPGEIDDVQLSDVRLEMDRWTDRPGRRQDLRPIDSAAPYPGREDDINGLRACRPPALHVEGARDVSLRDLAVVWRDVPADEFGPTLVVDRCTDVRWSGLRLTGRAPDTEFALDGAPGGPLPPDGRAG
ncbi:glycoside hydrolase family 28 protein [Plantactinospora siamensis]|uniref:Glycoside hydrolase family 28 protein n=1 Tax=Plantactinospora siamensis TaxID=555372 RepID=A0ABV6P4B0_9ACTN